MGTWEKTERRKEKKKKILYTRSARIKAQLKKSYHTLDKEVKKSTGQIRRGTSKR